MWIPEWLGVPYCILHAKFKGKEFSFEEAREELDIPTSKLLKVLSELGKAGLLVSRAHNKVKKYTLSDFDSFALGIKAKKDFGGLDIASRLRKASEEYGKKYLIVGGSAAFLYHTYQFPVEYEIEVFPGDYGFWSNLIPEGKLFPNLTPEKLSRSRGIEGLFVASPERALTEGLRKGLITSAIDSVSIILLTKLDWEAIQSYAIEYGIVNELGALLEALDVELKKEYGKGKVPKRFLDELFAHIKKMGRVKEYPKAVLGKDRTYFDIGMRWRTKFYLPAYVIKRSVEDLAPFSLWVA